MDIIILGIRGFPDSFSAKINRYRSITNMLVKAGDKVTVLNKGIGVYKNSGDVKAEVVNCYNSIIASYTLRKYIQKVICLFELFQILKWNTKASNEKIILVYTSSLVTFLFYVFVSKLLRIKLVYDLVERRTDIEGRKESSYRRNSDRILENEAIKYCDGLFIVSEYLKEHVNKYFSNKPYYKLPPVCDFEYFGEVKEVSSKPYILYCGSYGYKNVIDFVVEAYNQSETGNQLSLYLVINGGKDEIENLIEETKSIRNIHVFTQLSYYNLVSMYKNAKGLLIPLRNTVQDVARFPQKICEYTASNSMIISTDIGEIHHYFKHDKNALLAKEYNVNMYAELIKYLTTKDCQSNIIRMNGYLVGKEHFDENSHYLKVSNYLKNINRELN